MGPETHSTLRNLRNESKNRLNTQNAVRNLWTGSIEGNDDVSSFALILSYSDIAHASEYITQPRRVWDTENETQKDVKSRQTWKLLRTKRAHSKV